MLGEIDRKAPLPAAVLDEIVERASALVVLKPVDDRETAVVANYDDHLVAGQDGRVDVGVHHQIRAVADHHDGRSVAVHRHRRAPAAGDFVAHARVAEFAVVGVRSFRPPSLHCFARQAARGRDHPIVFFDRFVHDADNLRVGRDLVRRRLVLVQQVVPLAHFVLRLCGPFSVGAPIAELGIQFIQSFERVAHHRQRPVLVRVPAASVHRDEFRVSGKRGPRAGGEILKARSDGEHHVRFGRDRIRRKRADHADRSDMSRVVVRNGRFAGNRFRERHAPLFRERGKLLFRQRILCPASGNNEWTLCASNPFNSCRDACRIGARPRHAVHGLAEEFLGIVECDFLSILA